MQIRSYKFDSNSKYHQNEIWSDTMQLGANIPHSVLFILAKLETSFSSASYIILINDIMTGSVNFD